MYGRRRVGKTFLIQQVIGNDYAFYVAGMNNVSLRIQLSYFMQGIRKKCPDVRPVKTRLDAFIALETYLESLPIGRKIIFIDEMPWMDTPRSNFISGLEHFWNSWASWRSDIKLIVCGSATSWIINNLIKNRGGLHNRVTHKIPLKPFTLKECQQYFMARGFRLSSKQIAECYMVLGGMPFYIKIVTALAAKGKGLTRGDIVKQTRLASNGKLTLMLDELESCGFIRRYEPFSANVSRTRNRVVNGYQSPDTLYQLVDHFMLFHFQIVKKAAAHDPIYRSNSQNSHVYGIWSGLSFEMLCLNHAEQIKMALGISGIMSNVFSWFGKGDERKAQIDRLIGRTDKTINVCEMKFYNHPYAMTAKDEADIERKVSSFIEATNTDKHVIITMKTAKGIEQMSILAAYKKS